MRFAVNILHEDQRDVSARFADPAADRFAGVPFRLGASGSPILVSALSCIECRLVNTIPCDDQVIALGEVLQAQVL